MRAAELALPPTPVHRFDHERGEHETKQALETADRLGVPVPVLFKHLGQREGRHRAGRSGRPSRARDTWPGPDHEAKFIRSESEDDEHEDTSCTDESHAGRRNPNDPVRVRPAEDRPRQQRRNDSGRGGRAFFFRALPLIAGLSPPRQGGAHQLVVSAVGAHTCRHGQCGRARAAADRAQHRCSSGRSAIRRERCASAWSIVTGGSTDACGSGPFGI